MSKKDFVTMLLAVIGGVLFSIGMAMCLQPSFGNFTAGVVLALLGAIILLIMVIVRRRMEHKAPIRVTGKLIATILLAIIGVVVFGVGMCMVMVWDQMVGGVIVGLVGIVLLLCLIPLTKGLK